MITPTATLIFIIISSIFLLVIIPWLDGSKVLAKYISLRYTLVAFCLIMAFGCVLDLSHLAESSRNIVLMGGLLLVGLFVLVRSLEKVKLGSRDLKLSIKKGDAEATTELTQSTKQEAQDGKKED